MKLSSIIFSPPRRRLHLISLLAVLSISLGSCGKDEKQAATPAPMEIAVASVVKRDVPVNFEFVGQTKGAIDAEVRARVDGTILETHFQEGKEVTEGQLLYTLDAAPYLAKVAEAKGKLAEAETKLVKADSDLKRYRPLAKINAVSQRDLDEAVAQQGAATGAVEAAKAALESANIELGYTKIMAPVSGTIGISQAKVGEYVGKAPNPVILNTVSKLDPIHVKFSVTEKEYLFFARQKQEEIEAGKAEKKRPLTLVLADGAKYPYTGEVVSVDRQIDAKTGSLAIEAAFSNPNKLVRPGQFSKIQVVGDTIHDGLLVPKRAIRDLQGQRQIFVVNKENTIEQRTVTTGPEIDNLQVVESGLNADDSVAVEGIQRLSPGMKVIPKPAQG